MVKKKKRLLKPKMKAQQKHYDKIFNCRVINFAVKSIIREE